LLSAAQNKLAAVRGSMTYDQPQNIPADRRIANAMQVLFELSADPSTLLGFAQGVLTMAENGAASAAVVASLRRIQRRISGRIVAADCEQLERFIRIVAHSQARQR
jgi:hypothetical protein